MQSQADGEAKSGEVAYFHTAAWLGGAFLVCLLGVTVFTAADFTAGTKPEQFSETTAAGDKNYFRLTPDGEPVFLWKGRQYLLSSREKVKIDDTDMVRMGREETGDYTIYSRRTAPGKELFVKIDVGEFLPVRVR